MGMQWLEVDASALEANVRALAERVGPRCAVAPVIKSNAYGHGLELAAPAFARAGAALLCVHSFAEARRAQRLELGLPVLILGPLDDAEILPAVAAGLEITAYDADRLRALAAAGRQLGQEAFVHLKLETGTQRQGLDPNEADGLIAQVAELEGLRFVGVHSHFANVEDTTRHEFAREQLTRFLAAADRLRGLGLPPLRRHMASSAAAIVFDASHLDLIRPGISAYGHWPSRETLAAARERHLGGLALRPALRWISRLAQIKRVPAGSTIGYGCTHRVEVETRIGVLATGYADGYRRAMAGRAWVRLGQRRCAVLGRICMNLLMVDLSHVPDARVGDPAILLAPESEGGPSVEALAEWAGSIPYEILAGLSPELPRRLREPETTERAGA